VTDVVSTGECWLGGVQAGGGGVCAWTRGLLSPAERTGAGWGMAILTVLGTAIGWERRRGARTSGWRIVWTELVGSLVSEITCCGPAKDAAMDRFATACEALLPPDLPAAPDAPADGLWMASSGMMTASWRGWWRGFASWNDGDFLRSRKPVSTRTCSSRDSGMPRAGKPLRCAGPAGKSGGRAGGVRIEPY
jgi:hypothetical protein